MFRKLSEESKSVCLLKVLDYVATKNQIVVLEAVQNLEGISDVNMVVRELPKFISVGLMYLDAVNCSHPDVASNSAVVNLKHLTAQNSPFSKANTDVKDRSGIADLHDVKNIRKLVVVACWHNSRAAGHGTGN